MSSLVHCINLCKGSPSISGIEKLVFLRPSLLQARHQLVQGTLNLSNNDRYADPVASEGNASPSQRTQSGGLQLKYIAA